MIKNNRVAKYILYAIGEIFLVVIGILIALQVNTWNQNRQLKAKEIGYLSDIKSNLNEDLDYTDQVLEFNKNKQAIIDSLTLYLDAESNREEFLQFLFPNRISTVASFELFQHNKTAFENMKSANDISIISNDSLRYKLSQYYTVDPLIGTQERVLQSSRALREYLASKIIDKERMDLFFKVNTLLPSSTEMPDFRNQVETYEKLIDVLIVMRLQNILIQEYQVQIKDLIQSIERELEDEFN